MTAHKALILLIFSVSAGAALAEAAVDDKVTYVLCRNQKNVRTVHIEKDEEKKQCVTMYTKAGVDKEVGRGLNFDSCVKVLENIKDNLEKANWKCKGVGKVSITSHTEQ